MQTIMFWFAIALALFGGAIADYLATVVEAVL